MSNCNKILNNKLSIPSLISQPDKKKNNNHKKIESNCLTYVERKKDMKYIEEEKGGKGSNTLETNHNHYIYKQFHSSFF